MSIPMMTLEQFKDVFGADLYAEWTLEGYANYCDSAEFVEAMYSQYVAIYKEQAMSITVDSIVAVHGEGYEGDTFGVADIYYENDSLRVVLDNDDVVSAEVCQLLTQP